MTSAPAPAPISSSREDRETPPTVFTNCHTHTFTHAHTPDRFLAPGVVGWVIYQLAQWPPGRRALIVLLHLIDPHRAHRTGRYAEILQTLYEDGQEAIFSTLQGFYPEGTRFVVLPMQMANMNAGRVHVDLDAQHRELAQIATGNPALCPFAAVDPRDDDVVAKTKKLILEDGFCGIKLYPPTGYHPNDDRLKELYDFAEDNDVPVLTHCSRPAQVQYRGTPTPDMQWDPDTQTRLNLPRHELLTFFTSPDAYRKLVAEHRSLRVCLAHFGGAGDWNLYLQNPWQPPAPNRRSRNHWLGGTSPTPDPSESWLTKILEMIREFPNVWTDISYTLYANDHFLYALKTLLTEQTIADKVLFGSDFFLVENAPLEERHRSMQIRAVLGEPLFRQIAVTNAQTFLGSRCP